MGAGFVPIWLDNALLHLNGQSFSDAPPRLPLSLGGRQGGNGGQTSKKCSGLPSRPRLGVSAYCAKRVVRRFSARLQDGEYLHPAPGSGRGPAADEFRGGRSGILGDPGQVTSLRSAGARRPRKDVLGLVLKTTKGLGIMSLTHSFPWLLWPDLNGRAIGYEGAPGRSYDQLPPTNSGDTRPPALKVSARPGHCRQRSPDRIRRGALREVRPGDNPGDISAPEALDRTGVGEVGIPSGSIDWVLDGCGGQI